MAADEWDVLKAHARAQCVTAKDRLWCEMALAAGEMLRRLPGAATINLKLPTVTARSAEEVGLDIQRTIDKLKRAEEAAYAARARAVRKAAKAAKQAAREERKRMRREAYDRGTRDLRGYLMRWTRDRMRRAIAMLRSTRDGLPGAVAADDRGDGERMIADARDAVRRWEFRYAIACAEAGAVPGGRVH